jgi:uncharacterized protein YoxC
MAAIENLKLQVTADIAKAVAKLEDLQEELQDVAESIEAVDAVGDEGVSVRTSVDGVTNDLARIRAELAAFEAGTHLNIDSSVDAAGGALPGPGIAGALPPPPGYTPGDGGRDGGFDFSRMFRRLADSIGDATESIRDVNIRMSDLHNLMATLVPLLVVFIGAIPAVVTALVGLAAAAVTAAGAMAALAGFGALGVGLEDGQFQMDNLSDVVDEVRDDFIDAFAPLAERLEPLFRDMIDAIDPFFQAIANTGDALMELTDEARAFGGFLMDFVPDALGTLAGLVEALSPVLADIGRAINENFNTFVRQLVFWTKQAVPVVASLVQTIIQALPTIVDLGIQFAIVANAVLNIIGLLWTLLTVNGLLADGMGLMVGTLLVAITAFSLLNKVVLGFVGKALVSAITSLFRFMTALATANSQMAIFGSTTLASAVSSLISFTAGIFSSIAGLFGFSVAAWQAAIAAAAFWTAVTIGLALPLLGLISGMASEFLGLSDSVDQATSSLKEFDRVSSRASGGGINPYGGGPPDEGAAAAGVVGRNGTVINFEGNGDPDDDASTARYTSFRQGRTTGGTN